MVRAILGTAGHIDHGKSTLVKALTGIDPDRLPEEKARGITVDLGFAYLDLPQVGRVGVVDVPGHERFVRTMVAGATGIDVVLLVVAADEGVKPQTVEHLEICSLLETRRGVVVLTKCDLVDADMIELVRDDVRGFLEGSVLAEAPIVAVSAKTGEGLEELRSIVADLVRRIPERSAEGVVRLPVDRAFALKGHGTVVTGTLASGTLHVGEEVVLLPSGLRSRARSLQTHGREVGEAAAGLRVAVNLPGVEKDAVERGEVLTVPDRLQPTRRLAVHLRVLRTAARPLRLNAELTLHLGTASAAARVRPLAGKSIAPGEEGDAEVALDRPLLAVRSDRFILRSHAENRTIGGGEVLDPLPPRFRHRLEVPLADLEALRRGSPQEVAEVFLRWAGVEGLDPQTLVRHTGWSELQADGALRALGPDRARPAGKRFAHAETLRALTGTTRATLERFHQEHPLRPGMPRPELRERLDHPHEDLFERLLSDLSTQKIVEIEGDDVSLPGKRPAARGGPDQERVLRFYEAAALQPPPHAEAAAQLGISEKKLQEVLALLLAERTVVRVRADLYFAATAVGRLRARLLAYLQERGSLSVAEFKDLAGVTRKHAIPLLEYFDRERVTLRSGDLRKAWSTAR